MAIRCKACGGLVGEARQWKDLVEVELSQGRSRLLQRRLDDNASAFGGEEPPPESILTLLHPAVQMFCFYASCDQHPVIRVMPKELMAEWRKGTTNLKLSPSDDDEAFLAELATQKTKADDIIAYVEDKDQNREP